MSVTRDVFDSCDLCKCVDIFSCQQIIRRKVTGGIPTTVEDIIH